MKRLRFGIAKLLFPILRKNFSDRFAREAAAGSPDITPLAASAIGLRQALYQLPILAFVLAIVLFMAARLVSKLRVYTISDQDDSGFWIRTRFPDLFYIVSPGGYGNGTWTGIHTAEPGFDSTEVSNNWIAANIQQQRTFCTDFAKRISSP